MTGIRRKNDLYHVFDLVDFCEENWALEVGY